MPPTLDEVARERIRAWIDATGVTQTVLAARIGRTQAWMSRYLGGDIDADLETLQKLAHAFGHSLSALLETPTDPIEARVIQLFRALRVESRALIVNLLEDWTRRGRAGRRSRR